MSGPRKGREPTLGESRVGIDFNPGGSPKIAKIKRLAADLIDEVNGIDPASGEIARVRAVAMTEIEGAAMWAVKAAARSGS